MEMNPVVAVAAAAAAVVGGAALRHRHSNVAKQKQAISNPSSLGWNARPSPLLVAIRSTEGFLTLAPEQQQLLWTRLGCEGDDKFLPFLSPEMLWLQLKHEAGHSNSDSLYYFTPIGSSGCAGRTSLRHMLAASPETPYALAASQPSSIRGKSGSKGIQHLWKVEGETKQLINARFQTSAPAQVVPIAVMTSDDLTSWQQAMQTALNDKVNKVVLQARGRAQQAKQQSVEQQRKLDTAEQEQQRLSAELAAMAAARDAALQQSEQIAQELVQRDAEICGLLLKITKQDAALKAIQGRMEALIPGVEGEPCHSDPWSGVRNQGGGTDGAAAMLATSLQSANLDRLKLRLMQLQLHVEEDGSEVHSDDEGADLQDGGLSPTPATSSLHHQYSLITQPLRASRSVTQPGGNSSAAHRWSSQLTAPGTVAAVPSGQETASSPERDVLSRPLGTGPAVTAAAEGFAGGCTGDGTGDAVEHVISALRAQQQRRVPLAAEVQHLMESSEWHARLQDHLMATQPHNQHVSRQSRLNNHLAPVHQSWSWGAGVAQVGLEGGADSASMMTRQVSLPLALPAQLHQPCTEQVSIKAEACATGDGAPHAQHASKSGTAGAAGCTDLSTMPAQRQSSPAISSVPPAPPEGCADDYQVPLMRRHTSPGTWRATKAGGPSHARSASPDACQRSAQSPVLLPAFSPGVKTSAASRPTAGAALPSHALASCRTTTASEAGGPPSQALTSCQTSEAGALPSYALTSCHTSEAGVLPSHALASCRTTAASEGGMNASTTTPVGRTSSTRQIASSFEQLLQQQQQAQQQHSALNKQRLSTPGSANDTDLMSSGGRAAARAAAASRYTAAAPTAPDASAAVLAPRMGSVWGRQQSAAGRTPPSRGTSGPLETMGPGGASPHTPLQRGVSSPLDGIVSPPGGPAAAFECSAHSLGSSASDSTSSADSMSYNLHASFCRDHASAVASIASTATQAQGQQPPSPVVPLPLHQLTRHVNSHRRQDSLGQYTCRTVGSTCMPNLGSTRVMESSRLDTSRYVPSSTPFGTTPREPTISPLPGAAQPLIEQGSAELSSQEEEASTSEQGTACDCASLADALTSGTAHQFTRSETERLSVNTDQPPPSDGSPVVSRTAVHRDHLPHQLLKLYKHSDWGSGVMTDGTTASATASPVARDRAVEPCCTTPTPVLQASSHSPSSSADSPAQLLPLPPSHAPSVRPSPQQPRLGAVLPALNTTGTPSQPGAQSVNTGVWRPAAGSAQTSGLEAVAGAQAMRTPSSLLSPSPSSMLAGAKEPQTLLLARTHNTPTAAAKAVAATSPPVPQGFPARPSLYLDVRPALDQGKLGALHHSRTSGAGNGNSPSVGGGGGVTAGGRPGGQVSEEEDEEDMGAVSPASGLLPPSMLFQHVCALRSAGKRTLVQQQDSDEEEAGEKAVCIVESGQQFGGAVELQQPVGAQKQRPLWRQGHGAVPHSAYSTPTHAAQQRPPHHHHYQQHSPDTALAAAGKCPSLVTCSSQGDVSQENTHPTLSHTGRAGMCSNTNSMPTTTVTVSPPAPSISRRHTVAPQAGTASDDSTACDAGNLPQLAEAVKMDAADKHSGSGTTARVWLAAAAKAGAGSDVLVTEKGVAGNGLAAAGTGGAGSSGLSAVASQLSKASTGSESLASSVTLHVGGKPLRRTAHAGGNLQDSISSTELCSGAPPDADQA